jgi:hypothetical protein
MRCIYFIHGTSYSITELKIVITFFNLPMFTAQNNLQHWSLTTNLYYCSSVDYASFACWSRFFGPQMLAAPNLQASRFMSNKAAYISASLNIISRSLLTASYQIQI